MGRDLGEVRYNLDGESDGKALVAEHLHGDRTVITSYSIHYTKLYDSYTGQMVTMTYPLIGNYGVNPEDVESHKVQAEAFIVKECCKKPSNWRSAMSLPEYPAGTRNLGSRD